MTSRLRHGGALLLTAAAASACHPAPLGQGRDRGDRPVRVNARLDCPERSGALRRADAAADGRSCRYTGPDGQEVTLNYLALDGRPAQDALQPLEAEFRTLVPAAAAPEPGSLPKPVEGAATEAKDADDDDAPAAAAGLPVPPRPPEPPRVDRRWSTTHHDGERVTVVLPFLRVDADGAGKAHISSAFGDVDADDRGAVVHGRWNGQKAEIKAHDGGTEMRFGAVGEHRADLTYFVASDNPGPSGWRAAAYVARGPAAGPLVVASGRAREDSRDRHRDESIDDLKKLVNRNVRPDRS